MDHLEINKSIPSTINLNLQSLSQAHGKKQLPAKKGAEYTDTGKYEEYVHSNLITNRSQLFKTSQT